MKGKLISLALLGLVSLSACGANQSANAPKLSATEYKTISSLVDRLRVGFSYKGQVKATSRQYQNGSYQTVLADSTPIETYYDVEFTYQNSNDYIGIDRNIYLLDGATKRMIVDDNSENVNGSVYLNSVYYDNTLIHDAALDPNDGTGLNNISYGAAGFNNPFLSIDVEDFTSLGNNCYQIDNEKVSKMLLRSFSPINAPAFEMAVTRNILNLDENGDISKFIVYLDEYNYIKTDGDNYINEYFGDVYQIGLDFSNIGTANAKNLVKPFENKQENLKLRQALDKMEGKNLKIKRVDHTFYDHIEVDAHETINCYFDGSKIYYQVYELKNEANVTGPTSSDFLLIKDKTSEAVKAYHYKDNKWQRSSIYSSLEAFEYSFFLPVIGDISENIFDYDKEKDIYVLPENLAVYWTNDACLISGIMVSSPEFAQFINKVEIKINEYGDIEYCRPHIYFDAGSYIIEAYYDISYEYGDGVKMPYNIDKETQGL